MDELRIAAERRSKIYRARADRPQQRRSDVTHAGKPAATFRTECRLYTGGDLAPPPGMTPTGGGWTGNDDGSFGIDDLFFIGLASSTNSNYTMYDQSGPYEEMVAPGAFRASLDLGDQLDVPLVIEHESIRRIARTTIPAGQPGHLQLAENNVGLVCRAQLDPNDLDVQYILPKIRSGLLNEMSFRFEITSGEWSPDFSQYVIHSANLQRGDVSLVGFGANPNTFAGLSDRAAPEKLLLPMNEKAERNLLAQLLNKYSPAPTPRTFLVRDDDLR